MVNSESSRPPEKSGDLIFRLRDTSRTEYLSESTWATRPRPPNLESAVSRLRNRPHGRGGRTLHGAFLATRRPTKDLPGGARRS